MTYETDETGLFPEELKRRVLSQDGLYDLLEQLVPGVVEDNQGEK